MAISLKRTSSISAQGVKLLVYGQAGAGKTSLINALKDGLSPPIAPEHRTVSVQVSRQLLDDGVDLRIWDFAGGVALARACVAALSRNS